MLLLLCSGVILNVLVAWACETWSWEHLGTGPLEPIDVPERWPAYLEELDWPPPTSATRTKSVGLTKERFTSQTSRVGPTLDGFSQDVRQYGWPARSLLSEVNLVWDPGPGRNAAQMTREALEATGVRVGFDLATMSVARSYNRSVPIVPVWPGFAINTVFYTALIWLLFEGFRWYRRTCRINRGRCPTCTYPFGSNDVCTECGHAIDSLWTQSAKSPKRGKRLG